MIANKRFQKVMQEFGLKFDFLYPERSKNNHHKKKLLRYAINEAFLNNRFTFGGLNEKEHRDF